MYAYRWMDQLLLDEAPPQLQDPWSPRGASVRTLAELPSENPESAGVAPILDLTDVIPRVGSWPRGARSWSRLYRQLRLMLTYARFGSLMMSIDRNREETQEI